MRPITAAPAVVTPITDSTMNSGVDLVILFEQAAVYRSAGGSTVPVEGSYEERCCLVTGVKGGLKKVFKKNILSCVAVGGESIAELLRTFCPSIGVSSARRQ